MTGKQFACPPLGRELMESGDMLDLCGNRSTDSQLSQASVGALNESERAAKK
jgi:hypothetical protein